MPSPLDLVADAVDALAAGPLRGVVAAGVRVFEGRSAFQLLRLACLTAFCLPALWSSTAWAALVNQSLMVWFHEGGHGLFFFMSDWGTVGRFMIPAGGSLVQIAVPLMFLGVVFSTGKRFDASLMWLWVGLNFLSVAVYAADAPTRDLPLIFGLDKDHHDWWNMLSLTGLLWAAPLIAGALWLCGLLCYSLALVLGFRYADG